MYQPKNAHNYRFYRTIDSLIAIFALFAVFSLANYGSLLTGFEEFLALRIEIANFLKIGILAWIWPMLFQYFRLYEINGSIDWKTLLSRILKACTAGSLLVLLLPFINNTHAFRLVHVPWFWAMAVVMTCATRWGLQNLLNSVAPHQGNARRLIIVGSSPRACKLFMMLCASPQNGYDFLGFIDSDLPANAPEFVRKRLIGELHELESVLCSRIVDEVLITLPIKSQYHRIEETIRVCEGVGVEAKYHSDIFHTELAQPRFEFDHVPVLSMKLVESNYQRVLKRTIDLVCSSIGLLVLSPFMLVIAAAIKLSGGGPVFFAQERYGQNKRRFRMYKFRTMVVNAEHLQTEMEKFNDVKGPIFKMKEDPRITPIGKFLRKTSLDELPQLFNILKGEMSLVGPRPLPLRDVSRFDRPSLMRRFCVPPGLTCLWQISGRSEIDGDRLVTLDLEYIDKWSLRLDFQILAKTVPAVLRGTGAV